MTRLRLSLDNPAHGWLDVRVAIDDNVIEFVASDVPNNPVQELVDALALSSSGLEASVWWHLEPDGYYFVFTPTTDDGVRLQVLFAPGSRESAQSEVAHVQASRDEVLLPIWRALRAFQSLRIAETDWPPVQFGSLESAKP